MAISPEQALELTEQEQVYLEEWESLIDTELRQTFTGNNSPTVQIANLPVRILPTLVTRYWAVGWEVTHEDNQRDSSYLQFARKRSA